MGRRKAERFKFYRPNQYKEAPKKELTDEERTPEIRSSVGGSRNLLPHPLNVGWSAIGSSDAIQALI